MTAPAPASGPQRALEVALLDAPPPEPPREHASSPVWSLWVTHLIVPLALAAVFLTVAGAERSTGWTGVTLLGIVLVALATVWAPRVPAAAAGVVAWAGASGLLGLAVVAASGPVRARFVGAAAGFAVVAAIGVAVAVCWRPSGPAVPLAARAEALAVGAFRPQRSWPAWIVGAGLGGPLAAIYAPVILDVDSAWIVMAAARTRADGFAFLQETQEVLLPQLVLGPIVRTWGYQGAMAFTIVMVLALAGFASAFAYHLTRRPLGAFVAAGALLAMPAITGQAHRLPMYATMLLLGYGGALLVHRAMEGHGASPWAFAVSGGVALALAPEAHSLGQLFLVVPFLLLVLHPNRAAVRMLGVASAAVVVTSIPRIWINLSEGGFSRFRSNRTDWLVEQGYLRMINERLHDQRSNDGPLAYLRNLPDLLTDALGSVLLVVLAVLVVAAARRAERRTVLFGGSVCVAFVFALAIAAPGTYGRYLSPLAVGASVVAAVGAVALVDARRPGPARSLLAVALLVAVVGLATDRIATDVADHQNDVRRASPRLHELTDLVPEGAGVLGVRSNLLVNVDPTLHTVYGRTMSERDFVTYLTWPSDEAVIDMMRRLDVSWVVVRQSKFAETDYHETWLRPVYDARVEHQRRIWMSDDFCRVAKVDETILYRIGSCPGTD